MRPEILGFVVLIHAAMVSNDVVHRGGRRGQTRLGVLALQCRGFDYAVLGKIHQSSLLKTDRTPRACQKPEANSGGSGVRTSDSRVKKWRLSIRCGPGSAKAVLVAIELSRLLVVPDLSVAHHEFRPEFDISLVIADGRVIQNADYDLLLIVAAHDPDPHPLADTGDRVRKLGLHVIAGFVGVSHLKLC